VAADTVEDTVEATVAVAAAEAVALVDRPATLAEAMVTCLEIAPRVRNGTWDAKSNRNISIGTFGRSQDISWS